MYPKEKLSNKKQPKEEKNQKERGGRSKHKDMVHDAPGIIPVIKNLTVLLYKHMYTHTVLNSAIDVSGHSAD